MCGYKSADGAQDTFTHMMEFLNITKEHPVEMNDFCGKFIGEQDVLTNQESDTVLTLILECFQDYRKKKSANPEHIKKLSTTLSHIHHNANRKKVCVHIHVTSC